MFTVGAFCLVALLAWNVQRSNQTAGRTTTVPKASFSKFEKT